MLFTTKTAARVFAATLSIAVLAAPVTASINSDLQIEPDSTSELGGGQKGTFRVTGRNSGPVAVIVFGKVGNAAAVERGTLAPGEAIDGKFGPNEQALLRNTSETKMARLTLTISGDTSGLGMTYSPNP